MFNNEPDSVYQRLPPNWRWWIGLLAVLTATPLKTCAISLVTDTTLLADLWQMLIAELVPTVSSVWLSWKPLKLLTASVTLDNVCFVLDRLEEAANTLILCLRVVNNFNWHWLLDICNYKLNQTNGKKQRLHTLCVQHFDWYNNLHRILKWIKLWQQWIILIDDFKILFSEI